MIQLAVHGRDAGTRVANVDVDVRVPDRRDRADAQVNVALVQGSLASDVAAGENAGMHLAHEHVVRQWHEGLELDANGEVHQRIGLALPSETGPLTIVAFAERSGTGEVLQALSLPFCAP
jgi:hypothetical protein